MISPALYQTRSMTVVMSPLSSCAIYVLGFIHKPSEPKSLSDWEEVSNPLILNNTLTHVQPEQGANVEIKKGAEDLKDASTRTRTRDLWL